MFPFVNLKIVFKPVYKLNCLSKLKSQYSLLSLSNVIYKINCASCKEFYVGLTTRRLEQRLKEHSGSECSALFRHAMSTGHTIDITNPEILASDVIKTRLSIKETWWLRITLPVGHWMAIRDHMNWSCGNYLHYCFSTMTSNPLVYFLDSAMCAF